MSLMCLRADSRGSPLRCSLPSDSNVSLEADMWTGIEAAHKAMHSNDLALRAANDYRRVVIAREASVIATDLRLNIPQNVPYDFSYSQNIREASSMSAWDLIKAVKTGGRWDYKRGGHKEHEDFGNWHFGVVTRAWSDSFISRGLFEQSDNAFLRNIVQRGAGFYQQFSSGTSDSDWSWFLARYPYGDDPNDQRFIISGWETERKRQGLRTGNQEASSERPSTAGRSPNDDGVGFTFTWSF